MLQSSFCGRNRCRWHCPIVSSPTVPSDGVWGGVGNMLIDHVRSGRWAEDGEELLCFHFLLKMYPFFKLFPSIIPKVWAGTVPGQLLKMFHRNENVELEDEIRAIYGHESVAAQICRLKYICRKGSKGQGRRWDEATHKDKVETLSLSHTHRWGFNLAIMSWCPYPADNSRMVSAKLPNV